MKVITLLCTVIWLFYFFSRVMFFNQNLMEESNVELDTIGKLSWFVYILWSFLISIFFAVLLIKQFTRKNIIIFEGLIAGLAILSLLLSLEEIYYLLYAAFDYGIEFNRYLWNRINTIILHSLFSVFFFILLLKDRVDKTIKTAILVLLSLVLASQVAYIVSLLSDNWEYYNFNMIFNGQFWFSLWTIHDVDRLYSTFIIWTWGLFAFSITAIFMLKLTQEVNQKT